MSNMQGQVGELRMTVQITRKETGKTDTVELVSGITAEQHKQLQETNILPKEIDDGRNP